MWQPIRQTLKAAMVPATAARVGAGLLIAVASSAATAYWMSYADDPAASDRIASAVERLQESVDSLNARLLDVQGAQAVLSPAKTGSADAFALTAGWSEGTDGTPLCVDARGEVVTPSGSRPNGIERLVAEDDLLRFLANRRDCAAPAAANPAKHHI